MKCVREGRDPEYVYLSPICTAPERTWSDDGAADECECLDAKHRVIVYRRVGAGRYGREGE